jgi:hypothetical protein
MPVDNLWTTRRSPVQVIHILAMCLTSRLLCAGQRAAGAGSSQAVSRGRAGLCLLAALLCLSIEPAQAASKIDYYKLYAHSRIIDDKQYQCFIAIINKENRSWDVNARNGSHYGIGQMRSKHYRTLDAYRQIDSSISYMKHRYGSICKAWQFHQRHRYY